MPPFKSVKDEVFEDWPEIGEILVDQKYPTRKLRVTEIRKQDSLGRNVVGVISSSDYQNKRSYACDVKTLLAVWERPN